MGKTFNLLRIYNHVNMHFMQMKSWFLFNFYSALLLYPTLCIGKEKYFLFNASAHFLTLFLSLCSFPTSDQPIF